MPTSDIDYTVIFSSNQYKFSPNPSLWRKYDVRESPLTKSSGCNCAEYRMPTSDIDYTVVFSTNFLATPPSGGSMM